MPSLARRVVAVDAREGGVFLKLDCGHSVWLAGDPAAIGRPLTHRCPLGPCYRPDRPMGSGRGVCGGLR